MDYTTYLILMIAAFVVSIFAQIKVKSAYNKWSGVSNGQGLSGAEAARKVLDANGLYDVDINCISGTLTDNYNPKTNIVSLSADVYNGRTVAAVGIACHEVGHAIQHAKGYLPIKLRSVLVPVANFGSGISWWLLIGGLLLNSYLSSSFGSNNIGYKIAFVGVLLYAAVTAFHLVTLPVELNASKRAKKQLKTIMSQDRTEQKGVRSVLNAAAMTYVAAMFSSVVSFLRVLSIFTGSRRN